MNKKLFSITVCMLLLLFSPVLPASAGQMRVGIWNSPPYVLTVKMGNFTGYTLRVWEEVARQAHFSYSYALYNDPDELASAVQQGDIDAVVGPIAATAERAEKMAFSQPYYNSSMAIMTLTNPPTLWERIRPFLTAAFSTSGLFFFLLLLIVGTFLWLAEKRQNPTQFPAQWVRGVGNGIWLALSVFTTVGFGDIVPRSRAGRIICSLWMMFTMLLASVITAGLATVLTSIYTIERIPAGTFNDPGQLNGKHVAVIKGTCGDRIVRHWGGRIIFCDSMEKAVNLLEKGNVDAVVQVRMSLIYYQATHPDKRLAVSSSGFDSVYLAFAFRLESTNAKNVNAALLSMKETGKLDDLLDEWIGSLKESTDYQEPANFLHTTRNGIKRPDMVKPEPVSR